MRSIRTLALVLLATAVRLCAEGLNPAAQAKLDAIRDEVIAWAAEPVIVDAVIAQNTQMPAEFAEMNQAKWDELPPKAPLLRVFQINAAAVALQKHTKDRMTEAFLSDAQGRKIAFLAKTSSWSHQGKPKHEVPMSGKTWQGKLEVDQSAGTQQIQISVPVLSEGHPIGSLVVGVPAAVLMQ